MNRRSPRLIILICLLIIPFLAFADDFDGSKPLSGSVDKILEIYPSRINNDADPDTVGLPRNFFIDFQEKIIRPSKVVLSASGDGVAYAVFGTCTAVENFQK